MIYLPINSRCCCPQYSMRIKALSFQPSSNHKKVLRRLARLLAEDRIVETQVVARPRRMSKSREESHRDALRPPEDIVNVLERVFVELGLQNDAAVLSKASMQEWIQWNRRNRIWFSPVCLAICGQRSKSQSYSLSSQQLAEQIAEKINSLRQVVVESRNGYLNFGHVSDPRHNDKEEKLALDQSSPSPQGLSSGRFIRVPLSSFLSFLNFFWIDCTSSSFKCFRVL